MFRIRKGHKSGEKHISKLKIRRFREQQSLSLPTYHGLRERY